MAANIGGTVNPISGPIMVGCAPMNNFLLLVLLYPNGLDHRVVDPMPFFTSILDGLLPFHSALF